MRKVLFILSTIGAYQAYSEGGFYAGIGAGYANIMSNPQSGFTFSNGSSGSSNGGAVASTLYGGYDFNRYIGLQLDYDVAYNASIAGSYNTYQQLLGGSVLLHLPFSIFADSLTGFSLFAKGGVGYSAFSFNGINTCTNCVNVPGNAYGIVPIYGIGAEYGFSNVGIRAEWNYSGNITVPNLGFNQVQNNSNMYLLSILYHF